MADKNTANDRGSVIQAACIVAGNGIGSGVMAIPYFVMRAGILGGVLAFVLAVLTFIIISL